MPKVSSKKFVLVSIDEDGDASQTIRKLRRYLASHKLKHVCSSSPEEMKEYLELLQNNHLVFQEKYDEHQNFVSTDATYPIAPTNQELLEQWAKGTFSEGSDAINLLLGASPLEQEESAQNLNKNDQENIKIDIPQLFMVHSMESEAPNDPTVTEDEKEDIQEMAYCLLCEAQVRIGRNRNTRIKRQAEHVIDVHKKNEFLGVEIDKRYQCMQCDKMLPVSKSPCEHIADSHVQNDDEIEFRDLWTKEQTSVFNSVLGECFEKHLPVPRSRRVRSGNTWVLASKASYRILQGDNVVQINSVPEKPRLVIDKNNEHATNHEDGESGRSVNHQGPASYSEEDDYIHNEVDSDDLEVRICDADHDYLEFGEKQSTSDLV